MRLAPKRMNAHFAAGIGTAQDPDEEIRKSSFPPGSCGKLPPDHHRDRPFQNDHRETDTAGILPTLE